VFPELAPGLSIERVHARLHAGAGVNIRTCDDAIRRNEHVAVEEVLLRTATHVRLPTDYATLRVESAEQTVA
jgi:hypothetical protein